MAGANVLLERLDSFFEDVGWRKTARRHTHLAKGFKRFQQRFSSSIHSACWITGAPLAAKTLCRFCSSLESTNLLQAQAWTNGQGNANTDTAQKSQAHIPLHELAANPHNPHSSGRQSPEFSLCHCFFLLPRFFYTLSCQTAQHGQHGLLSQRRCVAVDLCMVQQGAASPPSDFVSLSGEEAEVQCVSPTVSSHPRWQRPEPHPETRLWRFWRFPQLRPESKSRWSRSTFYIQHSPRNIFQTSTGMVQNSSHVFMISKDPVPKCSTGVQERLLQLQWFGIRKTSFLSTQISRSSKIWQRKTMFGISIGHPKHNVCSLHLHHFEDASSPQPLGGWDRRGKLGRSHQFFEQAYLRSGSGISPEIQRWSFLCVATGNIKSGKIGQSSHQLSPKALEICGFVWK